jgi:L-ascorbate metabolism protein UlaG (beta-lactamase superfamily)
MLPESSVQAGIDLDADILFPIHWSKFDLAFHRWDEPANRFTTEAEKKWKKYAIPLIGEVFSLDNIPTEKWWNTLIIK